VQEDIHILMDEHIGSSLFLCSRTIQYSKVARLTVIAKDLCASVQAALQVELQLSQAWPCRSGEWGIMPFHWYFSSALPRALLGAYPLAVLGLLWEPRVRPRVLLVVAYVLLYSFLPHKEVCDADSVVD